MKYMKALILLLTLSAPVFADEVQLLNGGKIVGIARVDGDRVIIEMTVGTATVPKSDVTRIVPGRTILHEYNERFARIRDHRNAAELFELALWAKTNGVTRHVTALLDRTIALEPDHRAARELLGYTFHDGRWMTRLELLKALGYVEFRGRWVKPEDRQAILAEEAARRDKMWTTVAIHARHRTVEPTIYSLGLPAYGRRGSRVRTTGWPGPDGLGWHLYPWFHGYYLFAHAYPGWHLGGGPGYHVGGHHGVTHGHR